MRGVDEESGEYLSPSRGEQRRGALAVLDLAGKLVEQTHALVPAVRPGTRVGMIVHGPKTDLFVDRASCAVTSP